MLKEGEKIHEMGFGSLKLIQNPQEFCYGVDAVILADFAASIRKSFNNVMDLGAGTGAVSLILSHKIKYNNIIEVEIQKNSARLANANVRLNRLEKKIIVENCDILSISKEYEKKMDLIVSNPPYMESSAMINNNISKAIARHETTATLEDFICIAKKMLKDRGDFCLVHRPSRLVDIFTIGRKFSLEPKTIRFVCPSKGKETNIVLVHFSHNGRKELKVMPELYIYDEKGEYTDEIERIYERKNKI